MRVATNQFNLFGIICDLFPWALATSILEATMKETSLSHIVLVCHHQHDTL